MFFILILNIYFCISLCYAMNPYDITNSSSMDIKEVNFKILISQSLQHTHFNNVNVMKYADIENLNSFMTKIKNFHQSDPLLIRYFEEELASKNVINYSHILKKYYLENCEPITSANINFNQRTSLRKMVEQINNKLTEYDIDFDKHVLQNIYYEPQDNRKKIKNEEGFYLFRPGLIPYNCNDIKEWIKQHVPGQLVLSNGPVNNRYIEYTKNNDRVFLSMLSLRNAFNYEAEACSYLLLIKYFYEVRRPIKNISTICYGWQSIAFALHALTSNDEKAINIRKKIGIDRYLANALLSDLHYIEVMNPMLTISPLIEQCWRMPCITSSIFETDQKMYKNIFSLAKKSINYSLNFGIRTFFYGGVPYVSCMQSYNANSMMLLYDIKQKNYLKHINLLMHWEKYDEFVNPPSVQDIKYLSEIFSFYGIGAAFGTHNYYTEQKKLYVNYVRKNLHVPYYEYKTSLSDKNLWESIFHVEQYRENKQWEELKMYSESVF